MALNSAPLRRLLRGSIPSPSRFLQVKVSMFPPSSLRTEDEVKAIFEEWAIKHGKSYDSVEEKEKRFEIFKDRLRFFNRYNLSGPFPSNLGPTELSDLTSIEIRRKRGYLYPDPSLEPTDDDEVEEHEGPIYYFTDVEEEEETSDNDDDGEETEESCKHICCFCK